MVKEATIEDEAEQEMKEYLKDIQNNKSNKDVALVPMYTILFLK